jgi:DNA repair protein RadD
MSDLLRSSGVSHPLRPYQERAQTALRASLAAGKRRPMLQIPTGGGKTLLAAHEIRDARALGERVAFVVPKLSLIDQTVDAFEAEGIDCIGVIQADHPRTDRAAPLQICSVQTLERRGLPEVQRVFVDEAHTMHRVIFRWMKACPDIPFIGLSATPWSSGLGKFYDALIIAATPRSLTEEGYLCRSVVFAPSQVDLDGVRTVAGDFDEGELGRRVNTAQLVGDVIETWQARGQNRPTLCYGVNRAHAEHLQQRFLEAGIAAGYVDGFTDRVDRKRVLRRFRAGEVKIICNVGVLTTGVDIPMVSCIIDAAPTQSEIKYVQTIGRGLRTSPDKDELIVLDHASNALRLGLVIDIHHDRLDVGQDRQARGQKSERSAPLPRLCDACKAVLPARSIVCSECGATREAKNAIVHRDGELVELGSTAPVKTVHTLAEKIQFYAELLGYGRERGYRQGWAAHKFRERFGHWPDHPAIRCVSPIAPNLKTKNWIRSRQIAWAKGRAHG